MASFFLRSLFSKAPSHLICSSRAFSIFKTKKTEMWHSLGRMEIEFNFLDFENPNSITVVTLPSEIHALTSIFFLSQLMVNYIYILGNRTLGSRLPCASDVPVATMAYPKLQEILLEESSSLRWGWAADPF